MRKFLLILALVFVPIFGVIFWHLSSPETIATLKEDYAKLGEVVQNDLQVLPALAFSEEEERYALQDTTSEGIDIQFAGQEKQAANQNGLALSFPKDYSKPLEVKLDDMRVIPITDLSGKNGYKVDTLTRETVEQEDETFLESLFPDTQEAVPMYLRYTSDDDRKSLLYAYQRDQATGEKKLKHWTIYKEGLGTEQENYQIDQAKVRINDQGEAEVFYFGQQELQNEQVKAEVDSNLLERAQRTLAKEMGEDILNSNSPDFVIPKPYYIDREGTKHEAEWKWSEEGKTLSVSFSPQSYPVALDPTLSFTAPGVSNSGSVITGHSVDAETFGRTLASGDLNTDGRTDLVVGRCGGGNYFDECRVYIFYNDGAYVTTASGADHVITTSDTEDDFGETLAIGDMNADGRMDLIVGATHAVAANDTGRVYIFHNDGSFPTTTAGADVTIAGNAAGDYFGHSLTTGDFNSDGRVDLAVGANGYSSYGDTGRTYIFHNDGSIPTTAATADVTITGETTNTQFGYSLVSGDFNSDGRTDLAVGAYEYSTSTGRAYIFYNDGSIPTTAGTADVTITGGATSDNFGRSLVASDFNSDGRIDLAVGASGYSSAGGVFIFHNDGSIPTTAATADVTVTGEATSSFGIKLTTGDFNSDGRTDLAVGAQGYSANTGRAYILYNDGSIPTTAATADVMITGETNTSFSVALAAGDFNTDGRMDLAIGAYRYTVDAGRAYIFYSQNGQVNTNQIVTGETTINAFGVALVSGDFNSDGRTDLAVGAHWYSTDTGRVYIFYGDGQIPTGASSADVTITDTAANNFGFALIAGDFNADGRIDLAGGAYSYSTNTGRVYIFHNDGSFPSSTSSADVTITGGATNNDFGSSLAAGDFNSDGTTDLAVGANAYSSSTGRVYLYYNDGSIPTTAATADVTITGGTTSNNFGASLAAGDFNSDGRVDIAIGAYAYSTNTGRAYIFHNDGSIPTTAGTADVTITGSASDQFGFSMTAGDFNSDGSTDLAVSATNFSTSAGRVGIFYNDGSIPTTMATADVIITGEASSLFGRAFTAGDFNADGRTDLAVGAYGYSTNTGRAYIFHNDGSIPTTAATADVTITGETTSDQFGSSLTAGDFNADGRTDLAVGARGYSSDTGRVYFYETRENFAWRIQPVTGSGLPRVTPNGAGEELIIDGERAGNLGTAFAVGDFNSDGRADLAIGSNSYNQQMGRVYIFYSDGSLTATAGNADHIITGNAISNYFGTSLASGDFNADGRTDLAVGAYGVTSFTGSAYIFHNDGTLPLTAGTADVTITGGAIIDLFGISLATGDFNYDGETDLAVGAHGYSSSTGRAYIFHNDGSIPTTAGTADVTITGETTNNNFGSALATGDFNADSRIDLAIGAFNYSSATGRAYIFHNDGSIPTTAGTADVTITGNATGDSFGTTLAAGDLNYDGEVDLVVGAAGYSSSTGRAYIFHNDGSIPTTAATADVTITGDATGDGFGRSFAVGDFNTDSRMDLAIGADDYSTNTGRVYIFHNDGSIPTTAATADMTLTGETTTNDFGYRMLAGDINADGKTDLVVGAYTYGSLGDGRVYAYTFNDTVTTGGATSDVFGSSLATGDFNSDGRTDLAVGASGYSFSTGRVYIFYNDGAISVAVANADVTITGGAGADYFGYALTSGDFNSDGRTDLAVGAYSYSSITGRAYIFHNDGSIPTTAATADVTITGAAVVNYFGAALAAGDFNSDGRTDLAVSAILANSNDGRVYIFHNDGSIPTTAGTADVTITGETGSSFGGALAAGDFNTDGRTDLAVGTNGYSSSTGRAYIFHNDGSIPTTAATADVTITGGATSDNFGISLAAGDFNTDGKTDLAVGAFGYSTNTGRAYIFHNDGSIPTTAATADVTITGGATNNYFGGALAAGDFNADGRTDLAVGARGYSSSTGRAYIYHNDGSIQTTAATADMTLTGEASSSQFGVALTVGDFNVDGAIDLIVGANNYSSGTGRVYTFITEAALENPALGPAKTRGSVKARGNVKLR